MHGNSDIEIYQSSDGQTQVEVTFDQDTVWFNQEQLSYLFDRVELLSVDTYGIYLLKAN